MDNATAHILNRATEDFYAQEAESFSATRQAPWEGWERLLGFLPAQPPSLRVLDVGCGNLRFERFLAERLTGTRLVVDAIDSCPALTGASGLVGEDESGPSPDKDALTPEINFHEMDIVRALEEDGLAGLPPGHDLSVAFGLLHHVPLAAWRHGLVRALVRATEPGGIVAVSLWRFTRSARLARQAREATRRGSVDLGVNLSPDEGDWLLGWQGRPGVYRFCHDFSDGEVAALVRAAEDAGSRLVGRYEADGASGDLNAYVVLQRDIH